MTPEYLCFKILEEVLPEYGSTLSFFSVDIYHYTTIFKCFSSHCLYVPPVIFAQPHSPTQMLWNCFCGYLPLPEMFSAHTSIHRHEAQAFPKMISKCSKDINHPRTLTQVSVSLAIERTMSHYLNWSFVWFQLLSLP